VDRLIAYLEKNPGFSSAEAIAADIVRMVEEHGDDSSCRRQSNDDRTIVVFRVSGATD
jgi:hypothetical protein